MGRLANKVAVVTGASKGIGAGIAKALAAEGAAVVVNYASSKAGADAVVEEIKNAGGKAIPVQADVTKEDEARRLVNAAVQEFGRLDTLVNNSGIYEFLPIGAVTEEHYRRSFDVNVLGVLNVTRAAVEHLDQGGSIINISSVAATDTPPATAVYSGTKAALNAIGGVLAKELGSRRIRVNTISPGMTETDGVTAAGFIGSEFEAQTVARTPLGRIGRPDDIAGVAIFLASDDARWVTGENITASGGLR